jgi:archaellin
VDFNNNNNKRHLRLGLVLMQHRQQVHRLTLEVSLYKDFKHSHSNRVCNKGSQHNSRNNNNNNNNKDFSLAVMQVEDFSLEQGMQEQEDFNLVEQQQQRQDQGSSLDLRVQQIASWQYPSHD